MGARSRSRRSKQQRRKASPEPGLPRVSPKGKRRCKTSVEVPSDSAASSVVFPVPMELETALDASSASNLSDCLSSGSNPTTDMDKTELLQALDLVDMVNALLEAETAKEEGVRTGDVMNENLDDDRSNESGSWSSTPSEPARLPASITLEVVKADEDEGEPITSDLPASAEDEVIAEIDGEVNDKEMVTGGAGFVIQKPVAPRRQRRAPGQGRAPQKRRKKAVAVPELVAVGPESMTSASAASSILNAASSIQIEASSSETGPQASTDEENAQAAAFLELPNPVGNGLGKDLTALISDMILGSESGGCIKLENVDKERDGISKVGEAPFTSESKPKKKKNKGRNGNIYIGVANRIEWFKLQDMYGFENVNVFGTFVMEYMHKVFSDFNLLHDVALKSGIFKEEGLSNFRWVNGVPHPVDVHEEFITLPQVDLTPELAKQVFELSYQLAIQRGAYLLQLSERVMGQSEMEVEAETDGPGTPPFDDVERELLELGIEAGRAEGQIPSLQSEEMAKNTGTEGHLESFKPEADLGADQQLIEGSLSSTDPQPPVLLPEGRISIKPEVRSPPSEVLARHVDENNNEISDFGPPPLNIAASVSNPQPE